MALRPLVKKIPAANAQKMDMMTIRRCGQRYRQARQKSALLLWLEGGGWLMQKGLRVDTLASSGRYRLDIVIFFDCGGQHNGRR